MTERTDDLAELDAALSAEIDRREKTIVMPAFAPAWELLSAMPPDAPARDELDAVIEAGYARARLEVRSFVWARLARNLDSLGVQLVGNMMRKFVRWRSLERRAHRASYSQASVLARLRVLRRRDVFRTPTVAGSSPATVRTKERVESAIALANQAVAGFQREYVGAMVKARRADRAFTFGQLLLNAQAVIWFLGIQIVVFTVTTWLIGRALEAGAAPLGSRASLAAAVVSFAIVTGAVRPYLRRRFAERLERAVAKLFARSIALDVLVSIAQISLWADAVDAVPTEPAAPSSNPARRMQSGGASSQSRQRSAR